MPHSDRSYRLTGFGLSIHSDRDVPGALPDHAAVGMPDLSIATLPPAAPPEALPPVYRWKHDTLTFSAAGVGRYCCCRDMIQIAAEPGADPEMITALLIATALPAVAWLRGGTMLHAAGVVALSGGSALAIAGPSGVGKSALTAQLLDDGGTLLADDSICMRRDGDRIAGSGLAGGYHLRQADEDARAFCPLPPTQSIAAATIGAVVVLAQGDGPPVLARLTPVAAIEKLFANLHRPTIPALLGRRAEMLATMAFIAGNCAVYDWRRPSAALGMAEREMLAREGLW